MSSISSSAWLIFAGRSSCSAGRCCGAPCRSLPDGGRLLRLGLGSLTGLLLLRLAAFHDAPADPGTRSNSELPRFFGAGSGTAVGATKRSVFSDGPCWRGPASAGRGAMKAPSWFWPRKGPVTRSCSRARWGAASSPDTAAAGARPSVPAERPARAAERRDRSLLDMVLRLFDEGPHRVADRGVALTRMALDRVAWCAWLWGMCRGC